MEQKQMIQIATNTLIPLLGPCGLDRVEVIPGLDHDETPSLFVTAYYRPGSSVPKGEVLLKALGALHTAFQDAGEERFPYLDHRFPEDEAFDEDVESDEAAPQR